MRHDIERDEWLRGKIEEDLEAMAEKRERRLRESAEAVGGYLSKDRGGRAGPKKEQDQQTYGHRAGGDGGALYRRGSDWRWKQGV